MENKEKSSNFYQLTSQVLNDKQLNHAEKLTMAILNGLADEEGKCWPSNGWLMEKLDIKERTIQDILCKLENFNYISREIIRCEKNPFKTYRIIYVQSNFKLCLPDAENCTPGDVKKCLPHAENRTRGMRKTAPIIDKTKKNREEREREKGASPPTPCASPPSASQASEEMFTYTSTYSGKCRVKMTLREYKGLVEKYSKEVVEGKLEDLDNYADLNPKKFKTYANHASVLHNWLRKDDNTLVKSKPSPEANKAFAIKIMQLNPSHSKTGLIQMGYNYIEFRTGAHCHEVKFEDNGFKEQCSSCLRKMNLKIPGA